MEGHQTTEQAGGFIMVKGGNKRSFTTWTGRLAIKKLALKQRFGGVQSSPDPVMQQASIIL